MAIYLITGASSGIGEQMSRQAIDNGHSVYGVARRKEILDRMAEELGEKFIPVICDVTDQESVRAAFGALSELPDYAILNAGVGDYDSKKGPSAELHKKTFAVNYFGVLHCIEELYPKMAERGSGTLAATSSLAGYRGLPQAAAYSASKAALSAAMEGMAMTYHKSGVRFVTIHPGFIATPMTEDAKNPLPFLWSAEKAARRILKGVEKGKPHVNFPWPIHLAVAFGRLTPASLYRRTLRS